MSGNTEPISLPTRKSTTLHLVTHGALAHESLAVLTRPVRLGTALDNDVVLSDRTVSAHHCVIQPGTDGLQVEDLRSKNGTWIDGVRVMLGRLSDGTRMRLGRTELCVRGQGGSAIERTGMLAASRSMTRVLSDVQRFAALPWPVLILGESGVGKEGLSAALHAEGPRAMQPFVAINAGGISRELVESELFGHEKGSFTGAMNAHRGVFEQAHRGTLFLDEVGELPLEMQSRLLRVLETWEVRRVGASSSVRVDVRLVCATHQDLRARCREGRFRLDLYYRLARLVLEVPPLRERPEDVRVLTSHFLASIQRDVGPRTITDDAMSLLLAHDWPGNARELKNVLSAAAVASSVIDSVSVRDALSRLSQSMGVTRDVSAGVARHVLERNSGNLSAAARELGLPRSTLRDRLRASAKATDAEVDEIARDSEDALQTRRL